MKTFRLMKRLATGMPQPARAFSWLFPSLFLLVPLIYTLTGQRWLGLAELGTAGVFLTLFGFYVFRDLNGTASSWSRMYKESRGLSPEQFTFADVASIKAMGFVYMLMGLLWLGAAVFFAL